MIQWFGNGFGHIGSTSNLAPERRRLPPRPSSQAGPPAERNENRKKSSHPQKGYASWLPSSFLVVILFSPPRLRKICTSRAVAGRSVSQVVTEQMLMFCLAGFIFMRVLLDQMTRVALYSDRSAAGSLKSQPDNVG